MDKLGASSGAKQLLMELQMPIKYVTRSTSLFRHRVTPDKTTNAFRRSVIHDKLQEHLMHNVKEWLKREDFISFIFTWIYVVLTYKQGCHKLKRPKVRQL